MLSPTFLKDGAGSESFGDPRRFRSGICLAVTRGNLKPKPDKVCKKINKVILVAILYDFNVALLASATKEAYHGLQLNFSPRGGPGWKHDRTRPKQKIDYTANSLIGYLCVLSTCLGLARLQTLPSAFGLLLHRSLACVRREPGEGASGACSPCTAALELSLRNLPPRQPSNPSRQLAGQPATLGILDRHQTVLGSWQAWACVFSLPVPGLPLLFLWASESNVRHFGPASNPSQRLWPTPASQPCLRQAGAWGGSLWNVQPVHCSLRNLPPRQPSNPSRQLAGLPLLKPFSAAGKPASSLGLSQACLFSSYGLPKATLGIVDRPQTLLGSWQASQQR